MLNTMFAMNKRDEMLLQILFNIITTFVVHCGYFFKLLVDKLNRKVKDILLPMSEQIRVKDFNFTYSEFQIVKLIQEGKRSKEICDTLNISLRTVETHRMNIRKKLNISNQKTNLSSYLLSIK